MSVLTRAIELGEAMPFPKIFSPLATTVLVVAFFCFVIEPAAAAEQSEQLAAYAPEVRTKCSATEVVKMQERALQLEVQTVNLQRRFAEKAGRPMAVYIAAARSGASIEDITVVIDGADNVASHRLSAEEKQALTDGGAFRLGQPVLKPGMHRIHAEAHVRYDQGAEVADLITDGSWELNGGMDALVISPDSGSLLHAPALRLHRYAAAVSGDEGDSAVGRLWDSLRRADADEKSYLPGSAGDPDMAYVRFLMAMKEYTQGAAALMEISSRRPGVKDSAAYQEALTRGLIEYGALESAQVAYQEGLSADMAPGLAVAMRVAMAEAWIDLDCYGEAERALGETPRHGDKRLIAEWEDLKIQILLAEQRFGEVSEILRTRSIDDDFESYVSYFNLGVAQINNGAVPQGTTILDRVGKLVGKSHDLQALVDQANLVLGTHFLRQGQGATAIPILSRVRAQGPASNRALLNLGWAWMAPSGVLQQRTPVGDERTEGPPPGSFKATHGVIDDGNLYQRYHLRPFLQAKLDADQASQTKRALSVWSALIDRDAGSEPVQEAMLAAALALDDLDAHQEAVLLYERAIGALRASNNSMAEARLYFESNHWIDDFVSTGKSATTFDRDVHRLPPYQLAVYSEALIASRGFHAKLRQFRDLRAVEMNLEARERDLVPCEAAHTASNQQSSQTSPMTCASFSVAPVSGDEAAEVLGLRKAMDEAIAQINIQEMTVIEAMRTALLEDLSRQQGIAANLLRGAYFQLAREYDHSAQQDQAFAAVP